VYTPLFDYIQKFIPLDDQKKDIISRLVQIIELPKKTYFLMEGEISNKEGFVVKGCLKSYFHDQNGNEVIVSFASENWWVGDIRSFQEQKPSLLNIETLEPTTLYYFTQERKSELVQHIPEIEHMYLIITQRALQAFVERYYAMVALSAEDRYHRFLKMYPHIPLRVPQHAIASYLGISPEFLSKIRNRMARNRK